jgi:hypothetical protein
MQGMLAKAKQNAQKIMSQQDQDELAKMQSNMVAGGQAVPGQNGYHGFKYYKQMMNPNEPMP